MATVILHEKYRCSDDCRREGCPEHDAMIKYQSVSDAYYFDNGKGKGRYFERGELETMIKLLKQLAERRADSVRV